MGGKSDRIVLVPCLEDVGAEITTALLDSLGTASIKTQLLELGDMVDRYYIEDLGNAEHHKIYNFPILLHKDLTPWEEANLYLYSKALDNAKIDQRTDALRREASLLLEYKMFCEDNELDIYDFTAKRPVGRPSYQYFSRLIRGEGKTGIEGQSINKRTKVVFDFYSFIVKELKFNIDLERVETTKNKTLYLKSNIGHQYSIDVQMRSQTVPTTKNSKPVPTGFVRDGGEDLRPLSEKELSKLITALEKPNFAVDERLVHYIALCTGARKQTIYTIRMRHLKNFSESNLLSDGTYLLNAGPSTGIDTKFDKPQDLYIPKQLAEDMVVYANCELAKSRRNKFKDKYGNIINDDDMYLFLSPHGNCHYMAKNDPRYLQVRSRPQGNNTDNMKKKLLQLTGEGFPKDFTFHWLRATFGLQYYKWLLPLVAKGYLKLGDEIGLVQRRMHHSDRSITEHYLKLFMNIDDRIDAQGKYEDHLFDLYEIKFKHCN